MSIDKILATILRNSVALMMGRWSNLHLLDGEMQHEIVLITHRNLVHSL